MSTPLAGVRSLNRQLGAPGRLAVILLIAAVVVFAVSLRGLGNAVLAPSAQDVKSSQDEKLKQLAADYTKTLEQQTAQFNGRSVFFIPSAPPPPPPPTPPPTNTEVKPPPPPPPPAVYGGPKLIAMVNDTVWFEDGQKLEVGGSGKDGLKLREIRPPWDVAVTWKDVEFTVSLFERDKIVNKPAGETKPAETPAPAADVKPDSPTESPKPETKPEAPKPDTPKPDEPKPDSPLPEPSPVAPPLPAPPPAPGSDPKPEPTQPETPKPEAPKPEPKPDQPQRDTP